MPTFYNFKQDGNTYSFDDVFIRADAFRQGNLWTWGHNWNGQLGINEPAVVPDYGAYRFTPVTTLTGGSNWKQVDIGYRHTTAIKTDGTLWTWGNNFQTKLGRGGNELIPGQLGDAKIWKQISSRSHEISAIKTDGTLWVWGWNAYAQLGTNDAVSRPSPVPIFGGATNWKQVSRACAAIKTDGTLWTWSYNTYGELGTNDTTFRSTPVQVFGNHTNWKQVSSGGNQTAAIKTDGTLWMWGYNGGEGRLGTNDGTIRCTPVTTFAGGTNWKQVSSGGGHSAAIKTDGTLWTWGNNSYGALGTNDTTSRATPVTTFAGGTNWKQVSSGGNNSTAAIKTDGTLWVWGHNYNNASLGINANGNRLTPVTTFAGGINWKSVTMSTGGTGNHNAAAIEYIDSVL